MALRTTKKSTRKKTRIYPKGSKAAKKQFTAGASGKKQPINQPATNVFPMKLLMNSGKAGRPNPSIYNA